MPTRIAVWLVALAVLAPACTPTPRGVQSHPIVTPDESATPGPPVASTKLFAKFDVPVGLRMFPGDKGRYVIEKHGKIWRVLGKARTLVLDLSDEVSVDAEQGLFDIVRAPDGEHTYVSFTDRSDRAFHLREYPWLGGGELGEPREVLVVDHPHPHHNGGQLQFGPDGNLYIAIGDGGVKENKQLPTNGDPDGFGRSNRDLLGGILRIDPRPSAGRKYTIPKDNPFVGRPGRDEVWAYGMRNPWRFSFDRRTGDLWIPDVGHRFWEEINFERAGSRGGNNYGWSSLEGSVPYKGKRPAGLVLPVYQYPHRGGPCAIIGGYVYRGRTIPDLRGSYVFGDFCTGALQSIRLREGRVVEHRYIGPRIPLLSALAEDLQGELYAASISGQVHRIVPASG